MPIPQCIIVTALSYFKAHVYPKLFKYHICLYVNDEWVNVTLVYLGSTEACSARQILGAVIRGLQAVMLLKAYRPSWQTEREGE